MLMAPKSILTFVGSLRVAAAPSVATVLIVPSGGYRKCLTPLPFVFPAHGKAAVVVLEGEPNIAAVGEIVRIPAITDINKLARSGCDLEHVSTL